MVYEHKCVECGKIIQSDRQQLGEALISHEIDPPCNGPFKRVYSMSGFILK